MYGIKRPGDFIQFEERVKMDRTSYIDGYIPTNHLLIEQKSMDKDLTKAIRQSEGTLLSPFQQLNVDRLRKRRHISVNSVSKF